MPDRVSHLRTAPDKAPEYHRLVRRPGMIRYDDGADQEASLTSVVPRR